MIALQHRFGVAALICAACHLCAGIATAQVEPQVDCLSDKLTLAETRFCASEALMAADAEMNEVFRLAITRARAADRTPLDPPDPDAVPREEALRQSQTDWRAFRTSDCAALVAMRDAGADPDVATLLCLTEKTLDRTKALRERGADL